MQVVGFWIMGGLIMALQSATLAYMLHRRRIEVHKRKRRAAHLKGRRFPISADWDRIMRDTTITGIKTAEGSKEEA